MGKYEDEWNSRSFSRGVTKIQLEKYKNGEIIIIDNFRPEKEIILDFKGYNLHVPSRNGKLYVRKKKWTDEERYDPNSHRGKGEE